MQGIIDIGSNTMRLSLYGTDTDTIDLLMSKKAMVGLAAEIDDYNNLSPEGIQKACEALLMFKDFLDNLNNPPVAVIATASLRNINNTQEAIDVLEKATGFDVTLLSGTEEAHYDSVAVRHGMKMDKLAPVTDFMVVDIGGGSTELVECRGEKNIDELSFPVGSLNQFLRNVDYLVPTQINRKAIKKLVKGHVSNHWGQTVPAISVIAGVGGSNRAALHYYNQHWKLDASNGVMEVARLKKMIKSFSSEGKKSVVRLARLAPDRMHTFLPGLIILCTIAVLIEADTVAISDWGVREGYLLHILERDLLTVKKQDSAAVKTMHGSSTVPVVSKTRVPVVKPVGTVAKPKDAVVKPANAEVESIDTVVKQAEQKEAARDTEEVQDA